MLITRKGDVITANVLRGDFYGTALPPDARPLTPRVGGLSRARLLSARLPLGYLVKQVQSAFRHRIDAALSVHGLTAASYAALYHLEREGSMHKSALADACWVTPQSMQRVAAGLERARLIRRLKGPGRAIHSSARA